MISLKLVQAMLLVAGSVLFREPLPVAARETAAPHTEPVYWLAAGDSFSSGEGISGVGAAGNECARSDLAFGPRAADILSTQRDWSLAPVQFPACTGAVASAFFRDGQIGGVPLPPQWDPTRWDGTSNSLANGTFNVVTMSFGGNDIGFADVVSNCLDIFPVVAGSSFSEIYRNGNAWGNRCEVGFTTTQTAGRPVSEVKPPIKDRIDALAARIDAGLPPAQTVSLSDFYVDVARSAVAPGGVLIVVGYPRLFVDTAEWAAWRGNRCAGVHIDDIASLNEGADYLETTISSAVDAARSDIAADGKSIRYVSRIALFKGHELCTGSTEYINGITPGLSTGSFRVQSSFHPNAIGHQVTAELVAGEVENNLTAPELPSEVQTKPSTVPPVGDGTSHWGIGEAFESDSCVVAWPTAPVRTTRYIQMTMSCSGVPGQFLFVMVLYGDPNLNVTPNTGPMVVKGTIVDIAQSEYGFTQLVVEASSVDF